jgi:hypothetical protein
MGCGGLMSGYGQVIPCKPGGEPLVSVDPPPYPGQPAWDPSALPPQGGYPPPGPGYPQPYSGYPQRYSGYPQPYSGKPAPKKYWYGIGVALLVIGLLTAVGVFVGALVNIMGKQPSAEHTFASGGSTTVHVNARDTKVVYIANADAAGGHHVHCDTSDSSGQPVQMQRHSGSMTLNQWDATFTFTAPTSGDFTVGCVGAASDSFGVGGEPNPGAFVVGILGALGGGVVVVLGIVTIVITAVLRRRRGARG